MSRHELPGSWRGESYYGEPPLKNPHWDWKVSGYIVLAGVSGAAQALAWIGGLRDRDAFRGAKRNARLMAMAGTAAGAALLIADLKTPGDSTTCCGSCAGRRRCRSAATSSARSG